MAAARSYPGSTLALAFACLFAVGGCPMLTPQNDPPQTADRDGDTVTDTNDACPGFDDRLDADNDGTPDGCDFDTAVQSDGLVDFASLDGTHDVDFRDLVVGDEVMISVPPIDGGSQAKRHWAQTGGADCSCVWSVEPSAAGTFNPNDECTTTFTSATVGEAVIVVVQTCGSSQRGFYQGISVGPSVAGVGCQSDENCLDPGFSRCNAATGECVECLSASDCPGPRPRCAKGECVECLGHTDCEDKNPCTVGSCADGSCAQSRVAGCTFCDDDADCAGTETPRCGPAGICRECLLETEAADCADPTPRCRATGVCVECITNLDCDVSTALCDTVNGVCVACTSDTDCSDPTARCDFDGGACVQCLIFSDCAAGEFCNIATHQCLVSPPSPPPSAPPAPPPAAVCGNGNVEGSETCDTGGESATCDDDCTAVQCGDGNVNQARGEACDTGGASATCNADCTVARCRDSKVNQAAGEACDTGGETATCDDDCTLPVCGDRNINQAAGEVCDTGGETPICDGDCTLAFCGDNKANFSRNEDCDGTDDARCPGGCQVDCTCLGIPVSGSIFRGDSLGPTPTPAVGRSFRVRLLSQTGVELDRDDSVTNGLYSVLLQADDFVAGVFNGSVQISAAASERVRFPAGGDQIAINLNAVAPLANQNFTAFFDSVTDGTGMLAGNGTETNPFRTIQEALNNVFPGDRVVIRPGVYVEQNLTPRRSGTADRPITIEGANQVILNRTTQCPSCQDDILSRNDIVILRGPQTTTPAVARGFTFNDTANDEVNPITDPVTGAGFGYYIFRNLNLTNYIAPFDFDFGTDANNYLGAAHHIIMEDVNMCFNRRGIRGRRGFHDLIARRVHCFDNNLPKMGLSGGVGANGHDFDNGNDEPLMQGGPFNLTFIDCDSCGHDDGAGPGGDADSWIFQAEIDNVTLIRCRAFNNAEDGFDFKCNNVFMNQCAAWNNGASACKLGGAEALDEQAGFDRTHNFTVRNSLFVCNRTGASSALLLKPHSAGTVTNCTMISTGLPGGSNTPVPVRTLGGSFEARTFTFRNSIFYQGQQQEVALLIFDNNLQIQDSHNIYYRAPGADNSNVIGARGVFFRTAQINAGGWATFLANGGFGAVPPDDLRGDESMAADPLFGQTTNPAGPFTLLDGSPALNTGVDLSVVGNDTLDCENLNAELVFDPIPPHSQRAAAGATIDVDCVSRPQGTAFDRGAYEQ